MIPSRIIIQNNDRQQQPIRAFNSSSCSTSGLTGQVSSTTTSTITIEQLIHPSSSDLHSTTRQRSILRNYRKLWRKIHVPVNYNTVSIRILSSRLQMIYALCIFESIRVTERNTKESSLLYRTTRRTVCLIPFWVKLPPPRASWSCIIDQQTITQRRARNWFQTTLLEVVDYYYWSQCDKKRTLQRTT